MPRLSCFYGIAIYLYFEDHPPPHVHARYAGAKAKISIDSGSVMEGSLPPRAARLVETWVSDHRQELYGCWERAIRGLDPGTIEPLI